MDDELPRPTVALFLDQAGDVDFRTILRLDCRAGQQPLSHAHELGPRNRAQLASLAIEHGLTIYSADTDFARFSEISWVNPLA